MRSKSICSISLLIVLVFLQGAVYASQIAGRLSLPNPAPAGGISIQVSARDNGTVGDNLWQTIPEGQTFFDYTLNVATDPTEWEISYYTFGSPVYLQSGYYSTGGTQWNRSLATRLSGLTDHTAINLQLLTGNVISGTISLPSGTAPADMLIQVDALDVNGLPPGYNTEITIDTGTSSKTYYLPVPPEPTAQWRVNYFEATGATYHQSGFYSTSGTQWNAELATTLPGATDHPLTNMTLLTRNTITGVVTLAEQPSEDITVTLSAASNWVQGGSTTATIASGTTTSPTFTLYVPNDAGASWRVQYDYDGEASILPKGFYGSTGTQWYAGSSSITLLPGGSDPPPIDIPLLSRYTIGGMISLPVGINASGAMDVQVSYEDVSNADWWGYEIFTIEDGANGTDYTLSIPQQPGAEWIIHYFLDENETYLRRGYFSDTGTQWNEESATSFPHAGFASTPDMTGKNLDLLPGDTSIQGTVSLPGSDTAPPGGMNVKIEASYAGGDWGYSTWRNIAAGAPSTTYSIPIPAGDPGDPTQWQVHYYFDESPEYLEAGFYSTTGTQWNSLQATTLLGNADLSNIPLTLLTTTGDIDGDGDVTLTDVILSLQIIVNRTPAATIHVGADVNGDGRIGLPEAIFGLNAVLSAP